MMANEKVWNWCWYKWNYYFWGWSQNKKEAQAKVDDILSNTSVKEAIKSYRNNIVLNEKVKQDKDRER